MTPRHQYKTRLSEMAVAMGTTYEQVVSPSKTIWLAFRRRRLYLQMSEEFPNLSTTQLGKLFNRNHSTIVLMKAKARTELDQPLPK